MNHKRERLPLRKKWFYSSSLLILWVILLFVTVSLSFQATRRFPGRLRLTYTPTPTNNIDFPPIASPSSLPSETIMPAYYYEANLEGFGSYTLEELEPGAMDFEYPVYLLPNSSEVVTLIITPNLDVNTNLPEIFQRVPIPANEPLKIYEYYNYVSNILVAPQMKASLTSKGISISPQFSNPTKNIYADNGALWSWIITTPEQVGTHPLYLSLYLGDNVEPIWSFSFTVSVTYPTDTPLPTFTSSPLPTSTLTLTPSPTLTVTPTYTPTKTTAQQLKEVFISKAPETLTSVMSFGSAIMGAILLFIGGVVGALIQRTRKETEEDLAKKPKNKNNKVK